MAIARTTIKRPGGGFSMIELIVVMAVVGILSSMVAAFMLAPMRGYLDSTRRAVLVDIANTALQRMARDIRLALPNSVRVRQVAGVYYLEFLMIAEGGRYREETDPTIPGSDKLDFANGADDTFDILGPALDMAAGDQIVLYNLGVDAETDAYLGGNRRVYSGAAGPVGQIHFTATGTPFRFEPPGRRFFVVRTPVSYSCNPATGELRRFSAYAIGGSQPTDPASPPLNGGNSHLLATSVTGCNFAYDSGAITGNLGQVTLWLQLTSEGESVSLYREMVVNNNA